MLGKDVAIAEDLVEAGFAVAVEPTGEGVAAGMADILRLTRHGKDLRSIAQAFARDRFGESAVSHRLVDLYGRVLGTCPGTIGVG